MEKAIDLLYFGHDFDANAPSNARLSENFASEVSGKYRLARVKDLFDPVKGYRKGVEIDGASQEDYYVWMISRGWATCSLNFCMLSARMQEKLLTKARRQYPKAFGE